MAPKKDKAKKEDEKAGTFNEVEKTFLELQLTECNRKVARLRTALDEFEVRHEELQAAYNKLDEDRADIIAYLKKMLSVKTEENIELKEKVKGLEEIRDIENERFNETTTRLEKNFTIMKDQLTSENKLLAGKLNTLEEFRAIRDDLMKKFEQQEQEFKDQEMKYKRIIYNAEKKFIIGKDNLKKEMEARLLQLAQDFQDATELRVAASTHRVIRENIAISNELDQILSTQSKLSDQNEKFKEKMRAAQISQELAEEERDKAISKSMVQLKVIDHLTSAFDEIKKEKGLFERRSYDFEALQAKIQGLTKENNNLSLQVRILEQNLHARLNDQNKAVVEASKMSKERDKLRKILKEAAFAIQAALKLDEWATVDSTREVMDRHVLLSHLLEIISQFREIEHAASLGTIGSFSKVYEEGDLGFVPKPPIKKATVTAPVPATSVINLEEETKGDTGSPSLLSYSTSSIASSMKTIPSIKLIPPIVETETDSITKGSIESFMASTKSTQSTVIEEPQIPKEDIEQQLAASKLEIQKSLMKDLAYSQLSIMQSQTKADRVHEKKKRSQVISETVDDEVLQKVVEFEVEEAPADAEKGTDFVEDKESEVLQQEMIDVEIDTETPKDVDKEEKSAD